ncbi:hypothetical protein HH310_04135 [Actinoplanes sp. TBRC 11911]|uniref:hypothetical protein n=1 Tax=Actinoplanes sp. TBRC 11911 TaxID=2729386 RepID=UPI00145F9A4D|nr:hypothetical protein [Actinoplanes sp. TBRC 11911]NMO50380.1 hypothetical protein [Actinoplanes sp. TBRC 11911]
MTNWLTAAGLALFAGGLATLICFRAVLFGGGTRRGRRGRRPNDRLPDDRRTAARQPAGTPRRRQNAVKPPTVEPRRRRSEPPIPDDRGGLASIGFAEYEISAAEYEISAAEYEMPPTADEIPVGEDAMPIDFLDDDPDPPTVLDRSPRRVGHRAEGWIRPQYSDDQPPSAAGDYWTPPPSDPDPAGWEPSARGYGWPVQVERLPPVPAYEPSTGFDLHPEPTEVVPAADRPHLPRSWSSRDDKPRRRPRPRPRPAASVDGNGVYVSRHAADPPR